jgi:hydroxyacylglutathione hydrolase
MAAAAASKSAEAGLRVTALRAFRDNYIWLLDDGVNSIVVDPGDASPVLEHLDRTGLQLAAILLTHWHADHVGGVGELAHEHHAVRVFGPAAESITGVTDPLSGGERLLLPLSAGRSPACCSVLSLPGHTRGHLAYALPDRLFSGDVLFGLGCGRLFEGTPAQMAASLASIAALPDATQVYCAHEYTALNLPFAQQVERDSPALAERAERVRTLRAAGEPTVPLQLGEEKETNPFLRCAVPEVIAAARRHDPMLDPADPVAVFAALRAWRNEF